MTQTVSIRTIEDYSFRTWPALVTRFYDGWLLRSANGYTRRANSVNPVYGSSLDVQDKIDFCEALYFERHANIHFKMTDDVFPADLDTILDQRGYAKSTPTLVHTLNLADLTTTTHAKAEFLNHLTPGWLDDFARLNAVEQDHVVTMRKTLMLIWPAACFMRLREGDKTIAVGLAVQDGPIMGLFDIVIDAEHRGQGCGQALVTSLLDWGKEQGAETAFLQVVEENEPARKLYTKMGFREAYQYWYRTRQSPK